MKDKVGLKLKKIMQCLCSGEQLKIDDMAQSPESLATRDYSVSGFSSRTGEGEPPKPDRGNIEEAESSLREGLCLNYEEARALLGRLEYQRGNIDAALHVFEGIDVAAVMPKIKLSITRKFERRKRRSHNDMAPPMTMHAVSLLLEAILLKAKALQDLGRFKEAAQSCKVVLDTIESALPEGLPESFGADIKLQETLNKAVEMLPELWKQASYFHEAIASYRRALLVHWNLDPETCARIQKEFAVFLLYGGNDARPPNLRSQAEGSFIPRNNLEEAILLLLILLRKIALKRIAWDESIIHHLTFALAVSGSLRSLASHIEELLPGLVDRSSRCYALALCYIGEGDVLVALNLLKRMLKSRESSNCIQALLAASRICGDKSDHAEEGVQFARKALTNMNGECEALAGVANCLLGTALSTQARVAVSDVERTTKQCEALEALEVANRFAHGKDSNIIFSLCLENAEQRKLDVALSQAKQLLKMEAGSNVEIWLLLARILSAQKRFSEAETILNAALDETGKWDQGRLLRTKAKVQIAQGQFRNAIETYTHLLALLQVRSKSMGMGKKMFKGVGDVRLLEIETWHDLAHVYTKMSQWKDAEACLAKSLAINAFSASRWHATGLLYEAKGQLEDALTAFLNALEIDPGHVPSLICAASVLRRQGSRSLATARSFLSEALRLDRTNHLAWYNLGMLHKCEGGSASEASDCFQAAVLLEETAPVENFR
ncbi:Tetratricopeptide repeat protein 7B [Nymphaea thermarum]|nr:Tetratricopeptide repeat protein 7B [Nymphaea thermarum]